MSQTTDSGSVVFTRTRQLRKSGGSAVVSIPPEIAELAELELGDDVEVVAEAGTSEIVLSKKESDD